MKILYYTFRTFPWVDKLENPFIFGSIKKELPGFKMLIERMKLDWVVGVAKSTEDKSITELAAINQFNKGVIDKNGLEKYKLTDANLGFEVRDTGTKQFCNYTAYRICQMLEASAVKHSFIHIAEADLSSLQLIHD